MKIVGIICLSLLCISVSAQVVYKTVKADGTVVYSDVSNAGAKTVKLSSMNSVVVPALSQPSGRQANQVNPKMKPATQYVVSIASPAIEETIRNNLGEVTVTVQVSPKKAGKFQLILDGEVVRTQSKHLFLLENIERGAHSIQVNFLDNSGKILALSKSQSFYLQKASALINAN